MPARKNNAETVIPLNITKIILFIILFSAFLFT